MQWDSSENLGNYQLNQLHKLLHHAINNVPFYEKLYRDAGVKLDEICTFDDFRRLPMITKSDVVSYFNNFQSVKKFHFVSSKTTGGSTGQAVTIKKSIDALARERAATWVAYQWAGVDIGDPQARFWGVPLRAKGKMIYKIIDFVSNRRRLSAFNINENTLEISSRSIFMAMFLY